MTDSKFNYKNENEIKIINSQCDVCSLYNKEQNKCIYYKDGIIDDIFSNQAGCKNKKVDSILDNIDENYEYYTDLYLKNFGQKIDIDDTKIPKQHIINIIKKCLVDDEPFN